MLLTKSYKQLKMKKLLKFGIGNTKLDKDIMHFSLPSGLTCIGANSCKAWVTIKDNKKQLVRGKNSEFTCFSASLELIYPSLYESTRHNFKLVDEYVKKDDLKGLTELINESLQEKRTKKIKKIRIHQSGDFYNRLYLEAWKNVAELNQDLIFYCYSKALIYFPTNKSIPNNFYLTASYGGKYDYLIDRGYFKRFSKVVFSEDEAKKLGLEIDKDDSCCLKNKPFALLLHGMQEKNTSSSEALKEIKRNKKLVKV